MANRSRELARKLGDALRSAPLLLRALELARAAAPGWTALWLAALVTQGLLPVAVVYLTRALVDGIVSARSGGGSLVPLLPPALAMAAALVLTEALRGVTRWLRTVLGELLRDHVAELMHERAAALDLACFESPEYYDRLHRARADAHTRPLLLLENAGAVLQSGITLAAMMGVLLPYGAWLPLALLASALPTFWVVLESTVRQHRWRLSATPRERRAWYYDWLLTSRDSAAEMRLFDLAAHFRALYRDVRRTLSAEQIRLAGAQARSEALAGAAALASLAVVMVWTAARAVRGQITLGDIALFYQAFAQGQGVTRSLFGGVGQIYANSLFLGDLLDFLALRPAVVDPDVPVALPVGLQRGIQFRGVTFTYPGSDRPALQNFSLSIPAGAVVAIVGANGAGKSTLIKLLCRLYDPQEGSVEIDGVDVRALALRDLRRMISVLFQEPVHYSETAAGNIGLGDLPARPGVAAIESAARAAGADVCIERLPQGYEALLGRWFGGHELSVGEWQRIALARAVLRNAPIIVLDEPTSAMDSWAEADWLARFRILADGRTGIVVTHRFTTAMRADVIHVFADGRVAESGTHEALLRRGGRYATSWQRQSAASEPASASQA